MRLHYNNVNGCIYKKKKYKNFIANNNNLLNEIDINTNKFNNICPIGIFISLSGLNYKNQLSTVFNIKEMNNNNYISLFSLFIYDNQPPSVNWTYENNSNINSLDRESINISDYLLDRSVSNLSRLLNCSHNMEINNEATTRTKT